MAGKFKDAPVDPETRIRKSAEVEVGGLPALHQQWHWQDINGESLVFADEDISSLSNTELKKRVQSSGFVKGKGPVMLQRPGSGFARVNFNYSA